jgi:hypothetical protein
MARDSFTQFDLIGDVHGHYEELCKLLEQLEYHRNGKVFENEENHKLIFVGDLINRGPKSEKVLHLVKSMCDSGMAFAVLGNHEFRLVQHAVSGRKIPSELSVFLPWLRKLPMFLDMDSFRVVHAAWHFSSIKLLEDQSVEDDSFIEKTLVKKNPFRLAVQRILSGIKITIPKGLKCKDRFGVVRPKGRLKWWMNLEGKAYADCFLSPMSPQINNAGPKLDELSEIEEYTANEKPVFIGHYCLPEYVPKVYGQVVCLDGCVTCDKKLWGYRYRGEKNPTPRNLVEEKTCRGLI